LEGGRVNQFQDLNRDRLNGRYTSATLPTPAKAGVLVVIPAKAGTHQLELIHPP
jgi:hypothetical protein